MSWTITDSSGRVVASGSDDEEPPSFPESAYEFNRHQDPVFITTNNGESELFPIFCELSGHQIGWKTNPKEGCDPAYISLEVISINGDVLDSELIKDISTF
jgi:hypothetical protein